MEMSDNFNNRILIALIFFIVATVSLWFLFLPLKTPFNAVDVTIEGLYLSFTFLSLFIVKKLDIKNLFIGWSLFVYGLTIDFLDEFTKEPDLINTQIEGAVTSAGLFMIAVGIYNTVQRYRRNLRKIQNLNKDLEYQANTDPLTGLYNRRFLVRRLEEEMNRATRHERPLCAMLIDIDDFKQINDQYGHNSGDTVLQKIADLLDRAKRASDIAGRYGGDEFCIVFPDTDLTGVETVSDRLRGMMDSEEIVLPGGDRVSLKISFGAAQWDGREDLARFMDRADRALYRIKREE